MKTLLMTVEVIDFGLFLANQKAARAPIKRRLFKDFKIHKIYKDASKTPQYYKDQDAPNATRLSFTFTAVA